MVRSSLIFVIACACGNTTPAQTDPKTTTQDTDTTVGVDAATVPLEGSCPLANAWGGFTLVSTEQLALATGAVTDGVVPITVLEPVGTEGDCVLLRQNNPFCNPSCAANETCDFDGSCVPYPLEQDVGTVTLDGLSEPIEMTPTPPGFSYYATGLDNPPYAPGDLLTLTATGGERIAPFQLHGVGGTPLETDGEMWIVDRDVDTLLHWTPPEEGARTRVHALISIDLHGITPVQLECDFADTGQGTVPGSLLSQLIDFGVTGIPTGKITRWTVDSTHQGDACIDFSIAWTKNPEVDVIGFTPCHEDADCPPGETCNEALEICE